jgi:hypothetical protein
VGGWRRRFYNVVLNTTAHTTLIRLKKPQKQLSRTWKKEKGEMFDSCRKPLFLPHQDYGCDGYGDYRGYCCTDDGHGVVWKPAFVVAVEGFAEAGHLTFEGDMNKLKKQRSNYSWRQAFSVPSLASAGFARGNNV